MNLSTLIVVLLLAAVLAFLLITYNGLVRMRNRVQNSWSDIDVTLKRRHDLIPNLVETARGYMAHERETLENVTSARTQAVATSGNIGARATAELALTGALGNMMVTAERYPTLRASENMKLLQEQLTTTENRIAFARQCYNDSVREYNTTLASFPKNLIAGALGFSPAILFQAEAGSRENQQVAFGK
jgi:LemA protein